MFESDRSIGAGTFGGYYEPFGLVIRPPPRRAAVG